jgi:hypothetical protein
MPYFFHSNITHAIFFSFKPPSYHYFTIMKFQLIFSAALALLSTAAGAVSTAVSSPKLLVLLFEM